MKICRFLDKFLVSVPIVKESLFLRQLIRFVIAGGLLTIFDFLIYIFLTRKFFFWREHYLSANLLAMSIVAVASYVFNKNWVFENKGENIISQYLKFWLIGGIGGMVFYQFLFFIFVERIYFPDIFSKALSAVIVLFFRFFIQKFWIFK